MSIRSRLDTEKALEVLLYVAQRYPDTYTALKILYFADKAHLSKYGRLIFGDTYIAMAKGPVPSYAYDLVKYVRGGGGWSVDNSVIEAFAVQGYAIIPLRDVNQGLLSETDIECLDEAIEKFGPLPFGKLKALSHDSAYDAADLNDRIPLEAIVGTLPQADLILEYLRDN